MTWKEALQPYKQSEAFKKTFDEAKRLAKTGKVYPPSTHWFSALELTPLEKVKVVILGQDPYHQVNQAHGLAFSVQKGTKVPPSLNNIYKELERDLGIKRPNHGDLTSWAKQGVLLLNTTLTVEDSKPMSHKHLGWEPFTDAVIKAVNQKAHPVVFMLWGKHAQSKTGFINQDKHLVLTAPHPSPLSAHRGFLGCGHFSLSNAFLKRHGQEKIDYKL